MHAIGVSNPNVPIFLPRVCTLVLFIMHVIIILHNQWSSISVRIIILYMIGAHVCMRDSYSQSYI